jgi:hypothetical protein
MTADFPIMGRLCIRLANILFLSCAAAFAAGGGPAVYTVGNLEGISPGAEGILVLDAHKVAFRTGKGVVSIPYADIMESELGAKVTPPTDAPLYKVWKLHKRLDPERVIHQMLTLEYADKDGKPQTMTLEMEEPAAAAALAQIEMRQGKRHRSTNGEAWWGDSLWKTPRNNNTVEPEALGQSPAK